MNNRKVILVIASLLLLLTTAASANLVTSVHQYEIPAVMIKPFPSPEPTPVLDETIAQAGQFKIDRQVIAGGGGTSTAGTLRLDGTVAEVAAANNMTGGTFTLSGGYWNTLGATGAAPTTTIQFTNANFDVLESGLFVNITVMRTGDTTGVSTVQYSTSDSAGAQLCSVTNGAAFSRCDYITALGTLTFAPNETSKSITVLIVDDVYPEGAETLSLNLSNPNGAGLGIPSTSTLTIADNDVTLGVNPIDQAGFFVREHYFDFLNRVPDTSGLAFWTNEITQCGTNPQCIEVKRINVSAAFFLSIEFQETGYLVYRLYKTSFGNIAGEPVPVTLNNFLRDTQEIGRNVVVGAPGWETLLESNKQAFVLAYVQRPEFTLALSNALTADQIVTQLDSNAGGVLSASEKANLVSILTPAPSDPAKRAQVLRAVAEDVDLRSAEFNKAFVLMQYFGYLRRNPNDFPDSNFDGYNFWLTKLNQFKGNFVNAEMVRAFLVSDEYRHRFGP